MKMKKIIYILAFAAATLAATISCSKNSEWDEILPDGQEGITLRFSSTALETKAPIPGEDRENYVGSLQFFVFPVNADGEVDDDAKYILTDTYAADGTGWAHAGAVEADEETGTAAQKEKWTYTLTKAQISELFPAGTTKVKVFAVANYIDETGASAAIPADKETWSDIRGLEVGATFFKNGGEGFGLRWPRPMGTSESSLFFVMTGTADLELTAAETKVELERLASKVTVKFTYSNYVETSKGITWVPQSTGDEARVYLSNAIENTTLGGPLTRTLVPDGAKDSDHTTDPRPDRDVFEYAYDFLNTIPSGQLPYYYTYPIQMDAGDDNQPYLKLVLPWYGYKYIGTGTAPEEVDPTNPNWQFYKQKEVYYKIVLPRETLSEGNYIYQYNVDVNIIGSDKEVNITGYQYVVKDWSSPDAVGASVATGRFISLDIPKDEYDMYTDEVQIAFVSSGDVTPIVEKIYQLNLSGNTPTEDLFMENDVVPASATQGGNNSLLSRKNLTVADVEGWVDIPAGTSHLVINHAMDNRLLIDADNDGQVDDKNEAFDMSPYVFVVRLHLDAAGDETKFDRTVTITQYPSMYATSVKSNGVVFVNGYSSPGDENIWAYNNNNNAIGTVARPDRVTGEGTNNSQYSIIVHPTILDSSLDLYIGDSRVAKGGTLANINGLTNYKRSRGDTESAKVVSPGFMIASSYGKTQPLSPFARATERCASYQENGYPAGRWRVPTAGEIKFLIQLSDAGFIPSLFNARYYQSDGSYYESDGSDSNDIYVRCVYDTWYWGEEPVAETLTSWEGFYDNK